MLSSGAKGEILQPPATDLTRLVGRYEFFSSSESSFEVAVVEIVEGQLTISVTGDTKTLMPITEVSGRVASEIDAVSFQILGQADTLVRFFMSGENVRGLYYEEKRGNEDLVIGVAAPTFSGSSSQR